MEFILCYLVLILMKNQNLAHFIRRSCRVFTNHFLKIQVRNKIFIEALLICSFWFNWLLLKGVGFAQILVSEPGMFAKWPIPGLRKGRYKRSLACFVEPWCKEVLRVCAGAAMEEEPARGGSQWPDWASWVLEWTRTRVDYNPLNEIESRSSYLQWWREREGKAFPWSWMLTQSRTKDGTSKLLPLTLLGLIDSGRNIKMLHWGVPWQLSRLRIWRGCSWVAAVVRVPGPETYTHTPKKNIILSGVGD